MLGKVKWWNKDRGYGFILGEDGVEYFAHYADVSGNGRRDLTDGAAVEFEALTDPKIVPKGPKAVKIEPQ